MQHASRWAVFGHVLLAVLLGDPRVQNLVGEIGKLVRDGYDATLLGVARIPRDKDASHVQARRN